MPYKFKDIPETQQKSILDLIEKTDQKQKFNQSHTKILIQDLPFTTGWQRVVCEDYSSVPYRKKDYLYDGQSIMPCTYSDNPFENNYIKDIDVMVTEGHASFYLKFYCDYWVMGQDRLTPISYVDDIDWQDDISPNIKQGINDELQKYPKIQNKDGDFTLTMICVFRQSLLAVSFEITAQGNVSIVKRDLIIDDLPIRNFS